MFCTICSGSFQKIGDTIIHVFHLVNSTSARKKTAAGAGEFQHVLQKLTISVEKGKKFQAADAARGHEKSSVVSHRAFAHVMFQIARVTLPERRHRVQTYTWRGVPLIKAFTRLTLGFQGRLERRWEWETLIPKVTPLSQNSHLAIRCTSLLS